MPQLSGTISDFKSRGRELESRWGQTKIYLKEIIPWRILISSYFEPLSRWSSLRFEWSLALPITFYLNLFGHPVTQKQQRYFLTISCSLLICDFDKYCQASKKVQRLNHNVLSLLISGQRMILERVASKMFGRLSCGNCAM